MEGRGLLLAHFKAGYFRIGNPLGTVACGSAGRRELRAP